MNPSWGSSAYVPYSGFLGNSAHVAEALEGRTLMPPRPRQRATGDRPSSFWSRCFHKCQRAGIYLARGDSVSHPRSSPRPRQTAMARPHICTIAPACPTHP
ncbi:hypothetical protein E2C01_006244 [Portunus trituberculatus]|uniref:Uncharacterized protein n=1 Tax=Portunus trituberculatus TaxID=210409 RepID=A0A5B7CYS4_PORTR|nr:hypothetical protein [Portunus trituberculatus]